MPLSLMWRRKPPPPLVVWEGTPPPCVEEGDVAVRCGESDVVAVDVEKVVMPPPCAGEGMLPPGDDADVGKPSLLEGEGAPHRIRRVLRSHHHRYCVIWVGGE